MPEEVSVQGADAQTKGDVSDTVRMLDALAGKTASRYEDGSVERTNTLDIIEPEKKPNIKAPESINSTDNVAGDVNVTGKNTTDVNGVQNDGLPAENKDQNGTIDANAQSKGDAVENSAATDDNKDNDFSIEDPIYGGKKEVKKEEQTSSENIEKLESISPILKEYGIEDPKALPGVLNEYKVQKEEISNLSKELEDARSVFESMDPELMKAVHLNVTGKNWREALGVKGIDFSLDVEKVETRSLIDHFLPNQISNEDWDEYLSEDCDPNVKRLIDQSLSIAKDKYVAEKTSRDGYVQKMVTDAQERQDLYKGSLDAALGEMKEKFPLADSNILKDVSTIATPEGVLDLFFNNDGTLKKDSLVNLTMAKQGLGLVRKYEAAMERKIETKLNKEILDRGADVPRVPSSGISSSQEVSKEVQKELDRLNRLGESSGTRY